MPKEFRSLIPLAQARSIILDHSPRPEEVTVSLDRAMGAILAEKIISAVDVPGFSRASMDGYAVQARDTHEAREDRPVSLRLAGCVPMGVFANFQVSKGEAVEVSTGSMMPALSDAVVMIEYSQPDGDAILIRRPVYAGENVQTAGSDIALGEAVLFPGTKLATREIGVLAALGLEEVPVRQLKVGVASTGNELVRPGEPLGIGQIYDINSQTIAMAVEECGAAAIRYGILPDELRKMVGESIAPGIFASIMNGEAIFFDLPKLDAYTQMNGRIFHFLHTKRYSKQDFDDAHRRFLQAIPELKGILKKSLFLC